MTKDAFIRDLLAAAQESGIADAEVYFNEGESMSVRINEGAIDEYAVHTSGGLSLRGLVDGKMGMAYTEALDREAIVMLIRGVLESGTLISDLDEQFIFPGSKAYQQVDAQGDLGTPDERIAMAIKLDTLTRSMDPRVKEIGYSVFETERETVRIVNTHGLDLSHQADVCVCYLETIAREGIRVATGESMFIGSSLAALDPKAVATEAVEEAVSQLKASPCESGEMPVILRNTAMSSLLSAFAGIFNADAAQKGMSLLAGKEGEMIAAPCVTLTDDPLLPGGLYSRGFDAEGVATYAKNIIEAGKLTTLMHNLKTAKKAGIDSTGNAARGGYAGPVGIAPSNLCLQPGEKDLTGLQAEMGNGLVITRLEGLHAGVNAVSGDYSLLCRGYLVRDGKPGQAVEQVTVAGNIYQLLKDITVLGNDTRVTGSHVISPSVLIRSLSVAGK